MGVRQIEFTAGGPKSYSNTSILAAEHDGVNPDASQRETASVAHTEVVSSMDTAHLSGRNDAFEHRLAPDNASSVSAELQRWRLDLNSANYCYKRSCRNPTRRRDELDCLVGTGCPLLRITRKALVQNNKQLSAERRQGAVVVLSRGDRI